MTFRSRRQRKLPYEWRYDFLAQILPIPFNQILFEFATFLDDLDPTLESRPEHKQPRTEILQSRIVKNAYQRDPLEIVSSTITYSSYWNRCRLPPSHI